MGTITNLSDHRPDPSALMTPGEVARAFNVQNRSVQRWANAGKLRSIRTAGNHRRYFRAEVEALLRGES